LSAWDRTLLAAALVVSTLMGVGGFTGGPPTALLEMVLTAPDVPLLCVQPMVVSRFFQSLKIIDADVPPTGRPV